MKKQFLFVFFILFSSSLWAASANDAKQVLFLLPPLLEQELNSVDSLPVSLAQDKNPLFLSGQKTDALAEYKKQGNKIFVFKKPLKKWLTAYENHSDRTQLLAKCFAPVYLHELCHARDGSFGKKNGFSWPVTVSDEYVAVFWQVHFIKTKLKQNPDYYKECDVFMPNVDFMQASAEQLQRQILKYYSFLPPPMTLDKIAQLIENKKISYLSFFYSQKRAFLSLKSFFKKGGSWLELKPKELSKLPQHPFYRLYIQEKEKQLREIKLFF